MKKIISHFALFRYGCVLVGTLLKIVLGFGPAVCDNLCYGFFKRGAYPVLRERSIKQRHLYNFTTTSSVCSLFCIQSSFQFIPFSNVFFQELTHPTSYQMTN